MNAANDVGRETVSAPARHRRLMRLRWMILGLVVAAVSTLIIFGKYEFVPKRFGVVVPGCVYRSGQISKRLIEGVVSRHDIRVVVDLTATDPNNADQQWEIEICRRRGISYVPLPLHGDGTGDLHHYAQAIQILAECERAKQPVLIHCATGAQRTGGVVAVYRLLVRRESASTVRDELMRYGWKPHKNQILLDYLNAHMAELAAVLAEMGVLKEVPEPLPSLAT